MRINCVPLFDVNININIYIPFCSHFFASDVFFFVGGSLSFNVKCDSTHFACCHQLALNEIDQTNLCKSKTNVSKLLMELFGGDDTESTTTTTTTANTRSNGVFVVVSRLLDFYAKDILRASGTKSKLFLCI